MDTTGDDVAAAAEMFASTGPTPDEPELLFRLTAIYCAIQDASDVDVDADLISLGLKSIDAIRIANAVFEELGAEIALDEFLRRPTIREVASQLSRELAAPGRTPPQLPLPSQSHPDSTADWEEFTP